jgi:hypothetical protein
MRALLSVEEADVISDDAPVLPLHPLLFPFVAFEATAHEDASPFAKIALASLGSCAPDFDPMPLGLLLLSLADRGRDREDAKLFTRCGPLQFRVLA